MAENKKSFILYADINSSVSLLTDVEAGILFKHILSYVNDKNPELEDRLINLVFEPIKQQLKRDLNKWDKSIEIKSESGRIGNLKRWNIDLYKRILDNDLTLEAAESIAKHRKASQSDKSIANIAVTVNDNVNVTVNDSVSDSKDAHNEILHTSNLFRKPKIPNFEEVHRVFSQNGGTQEMAKTFYDANNAVEWFFKGSPIINFSSMVPNYIRNWQKNDNGKKLDSSRPNRIREAL